MKTLKVINVESDQDVNEKLYNKITLSTADFVKQDGIKVRVEPKIQRIVRYPESYLPDGSPQFGHDLKIGENVAGDIVTKNNLLPYPIKNKEGDVERHATSASFVVLGNSDNEAAFEQAIQKEFSSRGCFAADEEGSLELFFEKWGYSPETGETTEEIEEAVETANL